MGPRKFSLALPPLLVVGLVPEAVAVAGEMPPAPGGLGRVLPLSSGAAFAGMLLSIALFPLLLPRVWHHHFGKITILWGLAAAVPFLGVHGWEAFHEILHVFIADYVPFLILLWTLYTVAGGILLSGRLAGTPGVNAAMLAVGTFLASLVGTTGAAMLLVRPFLRANAWRKRQAYQVVFFIFLVCNVGGALSPLGDPPLFLGFLHGVPFFWTLRLIGPLSLVAGLVLALFCVLDVLNFRREGARPASEQDSVGLRLEGGHNALFLLGAVLAVLASALLHLGEVSILGVHRGVADLLRDAALLVLGAASLWSTRREIRERNDFSWAPMKEVAILFAGIFTTMVPVILILKAGIHGAMAPVVEAVRTPAHYFWASGILSSFLDNAPTYVVFLNTALGTFSPGVPEPAALAALLANNPVYLQAISAGAVFMGANSYIGNAPNFMVRSIAEEAGVEMPSFFGYIFKYSLLILVPSFFIATWVFF